MTASWRLTRDGYQLERPGLSGTLPLRGRSPGIRDLLFERRGCRFRWPGPLLAVQSVHAAGASFHVTFGRDRAAHRARSDLVDVQLDESARCPARVQIYWHAASSRQLDLEVLLMSQHEWHNVEVHTRSVPFSRRAGNSAECLVPPGNISDGWVNIRQSFPRGSVSLLKPRAWKTDARRNSVAHTDAANPPCWSPVICYRPCDEMWSYVEMSHPDDCVRLTVRCDRRGARWSFGLFGWDIEKGVILRGRVRGAFVPRRGDVRRAERLFRRFVTEPPHLSV